MPRQRHLFATLVLVLTAPALALACKETVCGPGTAKDCACPHGAGQMRCDAKGESWGACECPPPPPSPRKAEITEIKADDLGPADPKTHPNSKLLRVTFTTTARLHGEPVLSDQQGRKLTARPDASGDPNAQIQTRIFVVPNDASGLRLGVGADDPGQPLGEIQTVPAAERFRQRVIREHR